MDKAVHGDRPHIVISLGGSILVPKGEDADYIKEVCGLILEYISDYRFIIVVGGGRTARSYISWGRQLNGDEAFLDWMGITCTWLNAMLMLPGLKGHSAPIIPKGIEKCVSLAKLHDIVVMGGTHPALTTDAVAALIYERVHGIRYINATTVDGIYDSDPQSNPRAEMLPEIPTEELLNIVMQGKASAGPNMVMDPVAVRIMNRSRIKGVVIDGRDLQKLRKAIEGKEVNGTVILP